MVFNVSRLTFAGQTVSSAPDGVRLSVTESDWTVVAAIAFTHAPDGVMDSVVESDAEADSTTSKSTPVGVSVMATGSTTF